MSAHFDRLVAKARGELASLAPVRRSPQAEVRLAPLEPSEWGDAPRRADVHPKAVKPLQVPEEGQMPPARVAPTAVPVPIAIAAHPTMLRPIVEVPADGPGMFARAPNPVAARPADPRRGSLVAVDREGPRETDPVPSRNRAADAAAAALARPSPAPAALNLRRERPSARTPDIVIGELRVVAAAPPPAAPRRRVTLTAPRTSLADHLERRGGR